MHAAGDFLAGSELRALYVLRPDFREFGGQWFNNGKLTVNGPEAEAAVSRWFEDQDQVAATLPASGAAQ